MPLAGVRIVMVLLAYVVQMGLVHAHGFVHSVAVDDGQSYPGYNPFVDRYADPVPARVVRTIPDDGPVKPSGPDIACNIGGETGTNMTADVDAGSEVTFQWSYWPSDHLGPVSTYMTSCNGDCSAFDASTAFWFKLDAAEGYDNGQFASAKLMADNFSWTSTVPSALAPGQYLMRHEIVALHSTGDPQYYPSCTQVNVHGSGSGVPSDSYLITMDDLYKNVTWPDIWDDFQGLTVPGPPVVQFVGGDGNTGSPAEESTGMPTASESSASISVGSPEASTPSVVASAVQPLSPTGGAAATDVDDRHKCGLSRGVGDLTKRASWRNAPRSPRIPRSSR
ncbi:glycosyl hydrolase family 61-domain-containing protein [Amylostereum chailletii]|nr:glycosyl hydrolase family 61-domain-containing protein [Amylostereum chailletii]